MVLMQVLIPCCCQQSQDIPLTKRNQREAEMHSFFPSPKGFSLPQIYQMTELRTWGRSLDHSGSRCSLSHPHSLMGPCKDFPDHSSLLCTGSSQQPNPTRNSWALASPLEVIHTALLALKSSMLWHPAPPPQYHTHQTQYFLLMGNKLQVSITCKPSVIW